MAELTEAMEKSFDTNIAIGEYGTQLFWWNPTAKKFEYALPLVSGGEYGGDTETFEAPELDLDYVPKISGRTTLDDITLTSNYTKDRYKRWLQILSNTSNQAYLEVFSDNSASLYSGTAGRPTIQGGDVRQIETTVAPSNMIWVEDVYKIADEATLGQVNDMLGTISGTTYTDLELNDSLPFDFDTFPSKRQWTELYKNKPNVASVNSYGL